MGYSVKAQGIAMELFGQTENFELYDYVLPVQSLSTPMDLVTAFEHLQTTADRQKNILEEVVEPQKKKIYQIAEWMS